MRACLKRDATVYTVIGNQGVELPKGFGLQIIRYDYLPDHIKNELSDRDIEDYKNGSYVLTYLKKTFLRISADDVDYMWYNDWYN